jgi:hypothetical protein
VNGALCASFVAQAPNQRLHCPRLLWVLLQANAAEAGQRR